MQSRFITVPFALGTNEEQTPRELPQGPLREAVNIRQRRGSNFGVRADYPAQSMVEFSGNMRPFDLYQLNGRLIALGCKAGLAVVRPQDLFDFYSQSSAAWHSTTLAGSFNVRFSPITNVRNVGSPPDGPAVLTTTRVAAVNGYVCEVHSTSSIIGGQASYAHVFKPDTDATVTFTVLASSNLRVVVAGNSFWVLGVNAANDLEGYRFDTTSNAKFQNPVTLYTGTITACTYDACTVESSGTPAQFAFVVVEGSTSIVRRFNEAGAQQLSFSGPSVAIGVVAIDANSTINHITLAWRVGVADAQTQTYNFTSGASIVGPTNVFLATTQGDLTIARQGNSLNVVIFTEADNSVLKWACVTTSTNSIGRKQMQNFQLAGRPVSTVDSEIVLPVNSQGDIAALLVFPTQSPAGLVDPILGCVANEGTAFAGTDADGEVAKDRVNNKMYWSRLVTSTDEQNIPACSEFSIYDLGRRQACQIGDELFITGGLPSIYDGRQVNESGFAERCSIDTLTQQVGGNLLDEAPYDYVAIWRWVDSQQLEAKSMVSSIVSTTMAAGNHGNVVTIWAPHTYRRDSNTGSSPTIDLFRTVADRSTTFAQVFGSADLTTPPAALNGEILEISYYSNGVLDSTSVIFNGPSLVSLSTLLARINSSSIGGHITATSASGFLILTANVGGEHETFTILTASSALNDLGLIAGPYAGTTTTSKGTVFQRVGTASIPFTGDFGAFVTITDTLSDTAILVNKAVYTQGERGDLSGILEHEPAPSCKYCWTVGSRVMIGGLQDTSEVRISKALFPAEALAFSSNFAFTSRVDGIVTAVAGLDGTPLAFTKDALYRFSAQLPNDSGLDGELGEPQRIPSEGGCLNANSLIEISEGLLYQSSLNKIMLLPRGGGSPQWVGQNVQDTLVAFPNITSATYVDVDHCAVFTCQNTGGTDTRIIVLDLRIHQWYVDTFASPQVINASTFFNGLLAYIDTATVRLQSSTLAPATFIPFNCKTGDIQPFGGSGWGQFVSVTVTGTMQGDALLTVRISYDGGTTFTNLATKSITNAAGYTTGESFTAQWYPGRRKGSAFTLDFQVTDAGTEPATEGLQLTHYTMQVIGAKLNKVHTSQAERG